MIELVRKEVYKFLGKDDSGHGNDHIQRVLNLSLKFCVDENINKEVVALIALLHDVDDYKLVSEDEANNLINAKRIMNIAKVDKDIQEHVLGEIKRLGYSKALEGIRPLTIEGKIVSDADMCDAIGVNGFIRTYKYSIKHGGDLFNRDIFPSINMSSQEYKDKSADTAINHMFEKLLKLKNMMLTNEGKEEAIYRHQILVDILYHLFSEEDATEWKDYLDNYLKSL